MLVGACLSFAFIAAECMRPSPTPTLVLSVPVGYRGWLVLRPSSRRETTDDPRPEYDVIVDASGAGTVDERVISNWHKVQARYSDGSPLPVLGFDGSSPDAVMLRDGSTFGGRPPTYTYFVGTDAEMRAAKEPAVK
jgi:hypothetical protein